MKSGTLFSGFEGVGVGMRAAGLEHIWGIEYDDTIADVARLNGFHTLTLNILEADPALFERVDVLHASPPCPNFSVAKANGEETALDIALARKTADFIEVLRPKYFTLENVYAYRESQSWQIISESLYACGYWCDMQHVNFADLGVPQTRKRMIVRAVHNGFVPYLPKKERWVGWYESIEDLIPDLPLSKFPPWQLEILHNHKFATQVFGNQRNGDARDYISHSLKDDPVMTLTTQSQKWTAFIINTNKSGDTGNNIQITYEHEPSFTIKTSDIGRLRAFIVDGKLSTSGETKKLQIHPDEEPYGTVVSSHSAMRDTRAWLSHGRVVKMTPRALARFQTFPDWYQLPERAALACKGIGNAVPPLGMEKIYRGLLNG